MALGNRAGELAAVGIANQRETVVLWDRATGEPVAPAIVWQDRRTTAACERLTADGHEEEIGRRTGLRLDPYFSATKLAWLLDAEPGRRVRAERGRSAWARSTRGCSGSSRAGGSTPPTAPTRAGRC